MRNSVYPGGFESNLINRCLCRRNEPAKWFPDPHAQVTDKPEPQPGIRIPQVHLSEQTLREATWQNHHDKPWEQRRSHSELARRKADTRPSGKRIDGTGWDDATTSNDPAWFFCIACCSFVDSSIHSTFDTTDTVKRRTSRSIAPTRQTERERERENSRQEKQTHTNAERALVLFDKHHCRQTNV